MNFDEKEELQTKSPRLKASPFLNARAIRLETSLAGAHIGNYELESIVAEGGAGSVYRAKHRLLDKFVAFKVLRTDHRLDENTLARFKNEAQLASTFNQENVCNVMDFGILDDGRPYIVMDWIEGQTISDLIKAKNQISSDEAIQILLQVCEGLKYAHRKGLVHRDIKPSNVILSRSENGVTAKIVDFGIAKLIDHEGEQLTNTGVVLGSPPYMSPEQCMGLPVDYRSDIYSLGCLLYEMLAGRPPFLGETAMLTILGHIQGNLTALTEVRKTDLPPSLAFVTSKALEKKPEDRFQSVEELVNALRDGQVAPVAVPLTWQKPRRWQLGLIVFLGFLCTLLIGMIMARTGPDPIAPTVIATPVSSVRAVPAVPFVTAMSTVAIKDYRDGRVIYSSTESNLSDAAKQAMKRKVDLSFADLSRVNLGEFESVAPVMKDARFQYAKFILSKFPGAKLQGAEGSYCYFSGADLTGADFSRSNYHNSSWLYAHFEDAHLQRANFSKSELSYTDFTNADLQNANFTGANLRYCKLSGGKLSGAILVDSQLNYATLEGVDFRGATLRADLKYAHLQDAKLSNLNLTGCDLSYADLRGADLSGANLTGVSMFYAKLAGANLKGTIISEQQRRDCSR